MISNIRKFFAELRYREVRFIVKRVLQIGKSWDPSGNKINNIYCETFDSIFDNFINYRVRPKKSDSVLSLNLKTDTKPGQLAIVLQGVPETKDNFTLETVRTYKKIFPGAIIIISTWDFVNPDLINSFKAENCEIVVNKSFSPCGFGNVNYQICTSYSGILKAKEMGAEFVIKNRSDLRIYRHFSFEYLRSIQESFPVNNKDVHIKGRIITLPSGPGQLYNPLYFQDYFYFGYTDDLLCLFDIPYDNRNIKSSSQYLHSTYNPCTHAQMCDSEIPEIYIIKNFLKKFIPVDCSVKQMWNLLKSVFAVVDFDDLNAYWGKYDVYSLSQLDNTFWGDTTPNTVQQQISFEHYISICRGHLMYEPWMESVRYKNTL